MWQAAAEQELREAMAPRLEVEEVLLRLEEEAEPRLEDATVPWLAEVESRGESVTELLLEC